MKVDFSKVTRFAGRIGLKLKAASPEIMLAGGIACVIGAGVLACRATLTAKDIVEDTHKMIDDAQDDAFERRLPETIRKRNIFKVYVHQTGMMARVYAPALAVGTVGLGLIIGSHCVLNRRYIGTAAAYKAMEEAFRAYRKRVKEELGEEAENDIYYGRKRTESVNDIEDPEAIITPTGVVLNPKYCHSPYARFFDETAGGWKKSAEYNLVFLRSQQAYANNLLRARGHVFLNDVYDMLGIPRSQAGAVVGWVEGFGDNYIDFGLDDIYNEGARDLVNGYDRSILLDFNVDGVIWDKI